MNSYHYRREEERWFNRWIHSGNIEDLHASEQAAEQAKLLEATDPPDGDDLSHTRHLRAVYEDMPLAEANWRQIVFLRYRVAFEGYKEALATGDHAVDSLARRRFIEASTYLEFWKAKWRADRSAKR